MIAYLAANVSYLVVKDQLRTFQIMTHEEMNEEIFRLV